jgi:hypothetical protein
MHAPTQRVHHHRRFSLATTLDQGPLSPALCFTHRVSLPNLRLTAPVLALRLVQILVLPFLGSGRHLGSLTGALSVVVCLGLSRRDVADGLEQAVVVEPGHPFEQQLHAAATSRTSCNSRAAAWARQGRMSSAVSSGWSAKIRSGVCPSAYPPSTSPTLMRRSRTQGRPSRRWGSLVTVGCGLIGCHHRAATELQLKAWRNQTKGCSTPPATTRTAQNLNPGIFAAGSSAGWVSRLAAASA